MGHWSEELVDELAREIGGKPDRGELLSAALQAGQQIELLAGRSFHPLRRATAQISANGLPLVDVPDVHIGSTESPTGVWEIPDPVDPQHATVLQIQPIPPSRKATPVAEALGFAGQLVAQASEQGALSGDYVVQWIGRSTERRDRQALFRHVMDPAVRFHVPVLGRAANGWWFQVSRRLLWVTSDTEDEGRLLEPLLVDRTANGVVLPLAATEPVLIVARMTQQPVDWAFVARLWPAGTPPPSGQRWSMLAGAIHGHGIPTVTLDSRSTAAEVACQVILKAYWHGYIRGDDPALAAAIAHAYPRAVDRVRRRTRTPTTASAAAMLLEQLIRPGFDPTQGAEATRRYVRRKASIVVMEHHKREDPDRYPWTRVGISERRFYKLLPLFADKINGRYDYDYDDVVAHMRAHVDALDGARATRRAAVEVLRSRGFHDEAARKWLQRHPPEDALHARPRMARKPTWQPASTEAR